MPSEFYIPGGGEFALQWAQNFSCIRWASFRDLLYIVPLSIPHGALKLVKRSDCMLSVLSMILKYEKLCPLELLYLTLPATKAL